MEESNDFSVNPAIVYLALGSNLGDRADNLRRGLDALRSAFVITAVSPCYETAPAYMLDQPRFYNLTCRATSTRSPLAVLHELKRIEAAIGRTPGPRFGPRVVDLDLLFFDDLVLDTPELTIPHPRIAERSFVLVPLADIAPDLIHPLLGRTVIALRDSLPDPWQAMQRVEGLTL